jgi:hypothetical protein
LLEPPLPPHDLHGDNRTTVHGRRFMVTGTEEPFRLRSKPFYIQIAVLDDDLSNESF